MPRSFGEKLVAAVGLAAILILVGMALALGGGDDERGADPPPAPPPTTQPAPVTTATTPTTTPPPVAPPPAAGAAVLVVRATRGSSALSIRVESEEGASLFEGMVEEGRSVRVSSNRLWIRLGSASNVDLTINGRPVERLPPGAIDLIATANSVQTA
jgi:hypothetical protein